MIGRLRGELLELSGSLAVVEAAGVGYEVLLPDALAHRVGEIGGEVVLWVRQIFREDGVSLYGFSDVRQRRVFDLLLSVKGCGPKVALALLGQVGDDAITTAVVAQDARSLIKAQGVGLRLAERIILELKDKMQEEALRRKIDATPAGARQSKASDELIDTLLSLGYRRQEAESAADSARSTPGELQEQLRHALRVLQKTGAKR